MSRIWIDVSIFIKWFRAPVGITRVEAELIRHAINHLDNVCFFEYDSQTRSFLVRDRELILSKTFHNYPTVVETKSKILKKLIKPRFNDAKFFAKMTIKSFYKFILSFINIIYHSAINSYIKKRVQSTRKFLSKIFIKKNASIKSGKINRHPFSDEDIILSAGMIWGYASMLTDISLLKKDLKLSFYTFCYDIIPLKLPHLSLNPNTSFFSFFLQVGQVADHIFCISKNTEKDYREFLTQNNLPVPNTSIVTLGSDVYRGDFGKISPQVEQLINCSFILYVSTIERRKNHDCIYKSILYLLENGYSDLPKFVFVGMPGWTVNDLLSDLRHDPRIRDYIIILNDINDAELACLYQKMLFLVYPSFYEGWGIPIAESLNYGKMAIVSSTSSMPEVGGDLVDYVHPSDTIGWANRISYYLNNRDQLIFKEKNIIDNYQKISWDDFSCQVFSQIN